jgi:hypothetical protein
MKIFCTGNPARKTIAYALAAEQNASLSLGWDFTEPNTIIRFSKDIQQYNVFVNSAFIAPGVQEILMNACHAAWMELNIKGHIINIGTTLENTNDDSNYTRSKQKLKQQSLKLNDETGISGVKTSYIVLGGIGVDACNLTDVAETILWLIRQPYRVPLIQLESIK